MAGRSRIELQGERQYTPLEDAIAALSRGLGPRGKRELVDVRQAYGRVLGQDVTAGQDWPRWDASHFDGFAVFSADTAAARGDSPVILRLRQGAGTVGLRPKVVIRRGEAAKISTGGFLPNGADAVVPAEEATEAEEGILVASPVEPGAHVYRAGADVKKGETVLKAGRTLMGQDLVLLASLRFEKVRAFRRPRVAILPTGSELTAEIGDERRGKVVESHSLLLERLVEGAGGVARTLPIVRDEESALSTALRSALDASEIVLTLAGSSIGEPDLVDSAIRGFGKGTAALVHGVRVNRGRVMGVALVRGKPVVILPGPIQGALNAFIVFGYPLVRYHLGMGWEEPPSIWATMGDDWDAKGKFKDFDQVVYLRLTKDPANPDGLLAMPSSAETEKVSFLVSKNAYALVPGREPHLTKGERVQAHLLPGFSRLE